MDAAPPPPHHHHQAARPTGAVWSLVPWVRALRDHRAAAHAHEEKRRIIPRRTQLYTADYRQRQPSRGDVKLRTLRSALAWFDSIGFARSKHQRLFHESMLSACVRHLYDGEDFAGQYLKILEKNGWTEARQEARCWSSGLTCIYCVLTSITHPGHDLLPAPLREARSRLRASILEYVI
jgi:hypothetical protein